MPEVDLDANLQLVITTGAGSTAIAQIRGTGSQLTIEVDQPRILLEVFERVELARFADLLSGLGVTATVVTPAGKLALLGAGVHSRLGRLAIGSTRIAPTRRAARLGLSPGALRGRPAAVIGAVSAMFRRLR